MKNKKQKRREGAGVTESGQRWQTQDLLPKGFAGSNPAPRITDSQKEMRKKHLEMLLERLDDIPSPDVHTEQYTTPASVAAEMLFFAFTNGDIAYKTVADLGCGNGILGIGAKILGADRVICVDIDEKCLEVARINCRKIGVDVEFVCCDVREFNEKCDTVVMNPPFGAQIANRHADRIFIECAMRISDTIYSIHNAESENFIKSFMPDDFEVLCIISKFPMKRRFSFHKRDRKVMEIGIYRMKRIRGR